MSVKPIEGETMRAPLTQFTVQRWMVAVAVLALALVLVREGSPLRFVFLLMLVGFPVLITGKRGMTLTLRTDSLSAGYCYFAGVVGQAVFLAFDPFVFQNAFVTGSMLGSVRPFGVSFVGFEMALLTFWLWLGDALSPLSGLIAGALRVGAVFATCAGLALLSFSVPRWTILMRVLGFIQFLAAYAYSIKQSWPRACPVRSR